MTPEQIAELPNKLERWVADEVKTDFYMDITGAILAITQLQEQNAKLEKDNESYASVAKLLARSQDSVDELEAQNANYKEQITALVKEKHRRERREE